jgi:hypothetical protein
MTRKRNQLSLCLLSWRPWGLRLAVMAVVIGVHVVTGIGSQLHQRPWQLLGASSHGTQRFLLANANSNNNCPVSSAINTETDGLLGYPMSIFAPGQYESAISRPETAQSWPTHNCTSPNLAHPNVLPCSTKTECPFQNKEYLDQVTIRSFSWNISHNFCTLAKALTDPSQNVRIIVFGGSITAGHKSEGCFCDKTIDSRCNIQDTTSKNNNVNNKNKECPWSFYFWNWLSKRSAANVTLHNLAQLGWNTQMLNSNLKTLLMENQIHHFSGNDIIFIDESANDFGRLKEELLIELASLGKRMLAHSLNYSWPTIVLLEHFISQDRGLSRLNRCYDRVAAAFEWPMWSAR